jgi:hypothetical protein
MSVDSDLVRVDLLKVKNLIYESYPAGSVERKNFLLSSKMTELNYLSNAFPAEAFDLLYKEYNKVLIREYVSTFLWILIAGCYIMLIHSLENLTLIHSKLFYVPGIIFCLIQIGFHVVDLIKNNKQFTPIKEQYEEVKNTIEKLMQEMKQIDNNF